MTDIQDVCQSLLKECHNNLANHDSYLPRQSSFPKAFRKKVDVQVSRYGASPQEIEQNNKIINKLRKKYHKKFKEVSIKKTNLGEDQMTFTPEEYARLQLIDQYQERGLKYVENLQQCSDLSTDKLTAVDRLKQLAKMEDLIEQVKSNHQWGETINKENYKHTKYPANKKLCFQKRGPFNFSSTNLLNWKIEDSSSGSKGSFKAGRSLNKYYFTVLQKNTYGRKQFLFTKYDDTIKTQQDLSLAEKIEKIKEIASKDTDKICSKKGPFMTDLRKEAIYGCQVLRQARKILTPSQLDKLQIVHATAQKKDESQSEGVEARGENHEQSCQAQQVLQKNYHRIRAQRKRIIQKMIC